MRISVLIVACLSACSSPPADRPHKNVAELLREAKDCERRAAAHETAVANRSRESSKISGYVCYDQAQVPVPSSGGERFRTIRPCFTEPNATEYHLREASRLRKEAAEHRAYAAKLVATEKQHCEELGELERSHSPFYHHDDILRVAEYREQGTLRGARVWFRKLPGLTIDWMRKATKCHSAKAAVVGYPESFMSYCPLWLPEVESAVSEDDDGIVVTVSARNSKVAAKVLKRAQAQLAKKFDCPDDHDHDHKAKDHDHAKEDKAAAPTEPKNTP